VTTRSLLDSQVDGTAEHNDMVPILLGLWKILDDAATKLEAHASHEQGKAAIVDRDGLLALLGVISLRNTLHNWLGDAESSQPRSFGVPVSEANAWRLSR
jgi:hypothetical protein